MTDLSDVVEPTDRKIHDILVHILETITDDAHRAIARDLLLTLPPMRNWPEDTLRAMYDLFAFVEIHKHLQ